MAIPDQVRSGDTITWIQAAGLDSAGDVVDSTAWAAVSYLRYNKAAEAVTTTGVARSDGGWDFTISATTSATMDAGRWAWQTVATLGAVVVTLGAGSFDVLASLSYTGSAAPFDGRSEAELELAEVRAAIRALVSKGAQQYSIGSRSYTALDLGRLTARESQLRAIVAREKAAARVAAGLGDPRDVFVRFS